MQPRPHPHPHPHTTRTTTRPRHVDGALIGRLFTTAVSLALLAVACGADGSAGSTTTIEPPSSDRTATPEATTDASSPLVAADVIYHDDPNRQVLDVYVPDGDGPFPTIMAIHGGGFRTGSKRDYEQHARHFVDRGIAVVPVNYRYAPATTHPGQVEDVHCALAWVHDNADTYGFDPSHIVAMGGSAGGYLVGMLATADDRDRYLSECPHDLPVDPLAGAVALYGMFDLRDLDDGESPPTLMAAASRLAGQPYDELPPDTLAAMSPIAQISGSEPPVLAINGDLDKTTPSVLSEQFVTALREAGVDAEFLLVEGSHGFDIFQPFDNPPTGEVLAAIERFVAGLD